MANVLYVDDEDAIGKLVARFFGRRGDLVHVARTLTSARELLAANDPDVIFLDLWLGTESGFELYDWLGDTKPYLCGRVVFVTGDLFDDHGKGRVLADIGRPVIRKPFDLRALEEAADRAESGLGT